LALRTAQAEVDLRVEAWPQYAPIETFALLSRDGKSVTGVTREEFRVSLDGQPVDSFELRLPASVDPSQSLSVVFVQADGRTMQQAIPMIQRMDSKDFAAAVRAHYFPGDPMPFMRVHPFTQTDGASGTAALVEFLTPGMSDRAQLRYGSMVPHTSWLAAGLEQMESPGIPLPPGPAAIVMQGNGRFLTGRPSQSDLVARANALGIPVFTLATADLSPSPAAAYFMEGVATATGGRYLSGPAYEMIHRLLNDAYQLVIPASAVTDCNFHTLEVTVRGETASMSFDRCDQTPDALIFEDQPNVAAGSVVVSNAVSIVDIDAPVDVSVIGGEYSIGCRPAFTTAPGVAAPGDLVCVRHTASREAGTLNQTTLIVGAVGATFYSSTGAAPQPPPPPPPPPPTTSTGSGGGGAIGLWDVLAVLGMLPRLRRRHRQT
jgi:hypothetical protein